MLTSQQKAKSDNKYYAAMRDKEAIEAERKNLARTLEKQGKAVDHFAELEKQLETQKVILSIQVHDNAIYNVSLSDYA